MDKNIKAQLIDLLEEVGVYIVTTDDDVNVLDYNIDSISFITFVISVENHYGIEIPDEFLMIDVLLSLDGFVNLVQDQIEERNNTKND